jgi:hypothetical protein
MRASIKLLLLAGIGSSLALFGACSSDGGDGGDGSGANSGGSDCEKLCARAEKINCGGEDCVEECETELPKCDAEFDELVSCNANAEALYCGEGLLGDGCEDEDADFRQCLLSGAGGAGSGGAGSGASGSGGSPGGTDCEKLCGKAANAGCEPANCTTQCETALPKCDAEFDTYNTCAANTGTITCGSDGKPDIAGCDTEGMALQDCLLGGGESCYDGQGACDPTVAGSCGAGMTCDFGQTGYACYTDGTVGANQPCTSPDDCGDNTTCAETSGGASMCLAFCCDDTDCVSGGTCTSYGNSPAGDPVSLCAN